MPSQKHRAKNASKSQPQLLIHNSVVLATALTLTALIGLFWYKVFVNPLPQIAEITNPSGTIDLSLTANQQDLKPNESTTIALTYSTGASSLVSVESEISYDPTLLELSSPLPHPPFSTNDSSPTTESGKLIIALDIEPGASSSATGQGQLFTFTLKALREGDAILSLSPLTLVTTTESTTNSLRSLSHLNLTITEPPPSTSPSPSPSPSASLVSKPNPPTNLKYNCYNNGTRITLRWGSVNDATNYQVVFAQKDGDHRQTKTSTRPEIDLDLKPNTTYSWQLAAQRDEVRSDFVSVQDIKCSGESTTPPDSTPTPTPSPTPAPSNKPLTQRVVEVFKKPSPTPSLTLNPESYPTPTPPEDPGRLADIFAEPTPPASPQPTPQPNLISKIFLGWQALFYRLVETLTH